MAPTPTSSCVMDAFEIFNDASHTSYRPGQQAPVIPFHCLPHHFAWHVPFRVDKSGWVRVWSAEYRDGRASERVWVDKDSQWTPQWCQFQPARSLPGPDRWVPAIGAEDDCCHFVRQSDLGQAQVLLHNPGTSTTFRCVRCPRREGKLHTPVGGDCELTLPPDPRFSTSVPGVGTSRRRVQFRALPSAAAAVFGIRGHVIPALLALLVTLHDSAYGMQTKTAPAPSVGTCRVGKFDWRIPPHLRTCNFAVEHGAAASALSPFLGASDHVSIDPDTSFEQLADVFLNNEPPWASVIVPIWPALAANVLSFVLEPTHASLSVIVIVSPDWQASFLVPSRTDIGWLLRFLQGVSRYPIFELHPPPNAGPCGVSKNEAIDWCTGDVIFAQPCEGVPIV